MICDRETVNIFLGLRNVAHASTARNNRMRKLLIEQRVETSGDPVGARGRRSVSAAHQEESYQTGRENENWLGNPFCQRKNAQRCNRDKERFSVN